MSLDFSALTPFHFSTNNRLGIRLPTFHSTQLWLASCTSSLLFSFFDELPFFWSKEVNRVWHPNDLLVTQHSQTCLECNQTPKRPSASTCHIVIVASGSHRVCVALVPPLLSLPHPPHQSRWYHIGKCCVGSPGVGPPAQAGPTPGGWIFPVAGTLSKIGSHTWPDPGD